MNKHRINLISDTVTKPTSGMLQAMLHAEVGDDVFREDPTVIALENKLAGLFGHEAGLFCPSGTMTNQIAIKAHTQPLDEMICEINSHVYQYEVGGYAFHSGIAINAIKGVNGKLNADDISENIKAKFDWLPRTRLAVIDNTGNRTGGNCYKLEEIQACYDTCVQHNLKFHIDGARIFNAIIAESYTPQQIGALCHSISICLSKGLGTPVGSVLLGNEEFIERSRRIRKVMGGGMRQAGILAAAGIYALDNHLERLEDDHRHAKMLADCLKSQAYVSNIKEVQTNIIIFDLIHSLSTESFLQQLSENGINASAFGKHSIRFVTHLDISTPMIYETISVLNTGIKY